MQRQFHFDEERITLPKGTRVVLRTDLCATDGYLCKAGTVGTVEALAYDSYTVRTPTGRRIECQRDQITVQRKELLPGLGRRQLSWEELGERVILSSVVGSIAWGLADETSDEDVKGVFVLPFEGAVGLWEPLDEIKDPAGDTQYWEAQKLVYQGLRADANTLELLWSPHVRRCTELGRELLAARRMFVSKNVFGTFGRYAMSQFRKMRAARQRRQVQQVIVELLAASPSLTEAELCERLCREKLFEGRGAARHAEEAIRDLYRSLFDRGLLAERGFRPLCELCASGANGTLRRTAPPLPGLRGTAPPLPGLLDEPPRWKNAYNLLRLLRSGVRWLSEGEPLIEVPSPFREELLAVKRGEVELEPILARADDLAAELERAFQTTSLPDEPDYEAAHRFLVRCREARAREHLAGRRAPALPVEPPAQPKIAPPRFELPEQTLRTFLSRYAESGVGRRGAPKVDFVVCSLVGSHSYGFPSRDSDFDLKAIHLAPAESLLGLEEPAPTVQFLGEVGGLELDFTSHEARHALARLLKGDGNVLERLLSPYLLAPAAPDQRLLELRALAAANLSRRFFRHYAGFFRGTVELYQKEGLRKIKTLLYMFRVALTGVHLLLEREVVADLNLLLDRYPYEPVRELLSLKQAAELGTVEDDRPYLELCPSLEERLQQAHDASPLPEEPPRSEALSDWLRRWRRGMGGD
jgi:predicted nucleotidyltransferase